MLLSCLKLLPKSSMWMVLINIEYLFCTPCFQFHHVEWLWPLAMLICIVADLTAFWSWELRSSLQDLKTKKETLIWVQLTGPNQYNKFRDGMRPTIYSLESLSLWRHRIPYINSSHLNYIMITCAALTCAYLCVLYHIILSFTARRHEFT